MEKKSKMSVPLLLVGVFLILIASVVHAYPGESCFPVLGGTCDFGERCAAEPLNGKWWVCESMNPTDWLNSIINAMNFGTLVCSSLGLLSGFCSLILVPLLGIVLGAAVLAILAFSWLSVPPGPILWGIAIVGAVIGFFVASIIAAWWIPLIVIGLIVWYLRKRGG